MNEFNQDPKAKIEKYKSYLNQRDQDEIMTGLSHFNSPILNVLGRPNASYENNIVDYINKEPVDPNLKSKVEPVATTKSTSPTSSTSETPKEEETLFEKIKTRIRSKESNMSPEAYGMVYKNTNHGKPGSGAWGAYQFIWHWHGDKIKNITGVKTPEEFLKSPEAQEKYFEYHYDTFLRPQTEVFKMRFPNSGLTDEQIIEGLHFRGANGKGGMFEIFEKGLQDEKLESNNPTLNQRLKT